MQAPPWWCTTSRVAVFPFSSRAVSLVRVMTRPSKSTSLGEFYPTVGYDTEVIYTWVATGLKETHMHLDADEFLTPDRVPLQKAYEMVMSGEIKDGKTVAGVLKLKALLDEGRL